MDKNQDFILKKLFNDDEISQIPKKICEKIENHFGKKFEEFLTAKALGETARSTLDNVRDEFEQKILYLNSQIQDYEAKLETSQQNVIELRIQLDVSRKDVNHLIESTKQFETEVEECRKERNEAADERDSLQKMVERRNIEIERLESDNQMLQTQLKSAIQSKCQALVKIDEVQAKEISLDFKEKFVEEERSVLTNQIQSLKSDLNRALVELQTIGRDNRICNLELSTKLNEKIEEVKITNSQIAYLNETVSSLTARSEELSSKLYQQNEEANKMMEYYKNELCAKTKLADLYKNSTEENFSEINELSEAITDLKRMLAEATDQYGELETKLKSTELKHEQELEEKNNHIKSMQNELKNANKILQDAQQENLNNAIDKLAPTATVTRKLIKSEMSITELYTKFIKATEELQFQDNENKKLNLQMNSILQELEEKAPVIKKQELDYLNLLEANRELTNQLENVISEKVEGRTELQESATKIAQLERENKKHKLVRSDLSRQVCYLLKEIEEARGGFSNNYHSAVSSDMTSEEVISNRLVTFGKISELQDNNQKLLLLVRDLSSKLEEMEEVQNNIDQVAYETKISQYSKKVSDMEKTMDHQNKMLNVTTHKLERFKKLYSDTFKSSKRNGGSIGSDQMEGIDDETTPIASNSSIASNNEQITGKEKNISELEETIRDLKSQIKSKIKEHDDYVKERKTNEKLMNDQFDSMRTELRELTSSNCKLMSQVEYNGEQMKTHQKNVSIYKKQISALEERNKNCDVTIFKHEQTIKHLNDEILNIQRKAAHAEDRLHNMKQETKILKDNITRVQLEKDSLYRERQSQSLIMNNIEMIKASFERSETEGKLRLEKRLDETNRECSALRRRLQEEQDNFRELSAGLKRQTESAKQEMDEEKSAADKMRFEIKKLREELLERASQIEDLNKKLRESLTLDKNDNPIDQAKKRAREFELKFDDAKIQIDGLKKEIVVLREHVQQYSKISQESEKELKMLHEGYENYKRKSEEELNKLRLCETALKSRVEELETEIQLQITDAKLNSGSSGQQVSKVQYELKETLKKLADNNRDLRDLREQYNMMTAQLQQVEHKYANEMKKHSSDIQEMVKMKEDLTVIRQNEILLKSERDNANSALAELKNNIAERQQKYYGEQDELEKRLIDLDAQNSALHEQLQFLSNKLVTESSTSLQQDSSMTDSSRNESSLLNRSTGDDEKGNEQLLKIMKYLRKEKDIAFAKVDILKTENNRLQSECKIFEKRIQDLQSQLECEGSHSESLSVTASKHEQILRKMETLNSITDSNRILREERDNLAQHVKELTERVSKVEDELFPLQEKNRELQTKVDETSTENISLRTEAVRWRQRANTLIEKTNKNPEEFKRIQMERENLAKMLTNEKENLRQINEELQQVRIENTKLQGEIQNINRQISILTEDKKKINDELNLLKQQNAKLTHECMELKVQLIQKEEDAKKAGEELNSKEAVLLDLRNKETQIRKIAKKYKDSYFELKNKTDGFGAEGETSNQDKQEQDKKIIDLSTKITSMEADTEQLRRENEELRANADREDRTKQLLREAKTRIMSLTDVRNNFEQELNTCKTQFQAIQQSQQQDHTKITALEKELSENETIKEQISRLTRENESLSKRVNQLTRQLGMQQSAKPTTSSGSSSDIKSSPESLRTANVKPMAGPSGQQSATVNPRRAGETPLASIRPMSVQNSRTAAVLPTSQSTNSGQISTASVTALVPPQQQLVHTTAGSSTLSGEAMSPTSSLTDYMPTTSSAAVVVATIQPMANSAEAESAEITPQQVLEIIGAPSPVLQSLPPQQQVIALVSPRIEQNIMPLQPTLPAQVQQQPTQVQDNQQPSTSAGTSSSGCVNSGNLPVSHQASSSNTVTTTQAGASGLNAGTKRPHSDLEGESSTSEQTPEKPSQQKRTRVAPSVTGEASAVASVVVPNVSESGIDVEYQVPTSSQRDQEDDVIILDSEEDDGEDDDEEITGEMADEPGESYEMEGFDQEQDTDENEGPDIDNEPSDNNEAEVDEMPQQSSVSDEAMGTSEVGQPQGQQQSQAISQSNAASGSNEAAGTSSIPRRQNTLLSRQQQATLLMLQHSFEETGDDSIVPSTPTLFVPRSSEAVSSPHPQVPTAGARFTFAEGSSSVAAATSDETLEIRQSSTVAEVPQQPSPSKELAVESASAPRELEEPIAGPSHADSETIPENIVSAELEEENIEDASQSEVHDIEQNPLEENLMEEGEGLDGVTSEGEKAATGSEELEEGREAEALSPKAINTRLRRGGSSRNRTTRSGGRGTRPIPIVWQESGNSNEHQESVSNTPERGAFRGRTRRARRSTSNNFGANNRY